MTLKTITIKDYEIYADDISNIIVSSDKKVINTINAHSYIVAKKDKAFKNALTSSDILLPDGEGIVLMAKKLSGVKIKKIAGADIHLRLLQLAENKELSCFYLGASETTLNLMKDKFSSTYKKIKFGFFSPPFKETFSDLDTQTMIKKVNEFQPDILFLGMTAPKQEKWADSFKHQIDTKIICSIGAVFDFIAETKQRAPQWIISSRLEWLYRSFTEWRLTKRYLYSTPLFILELYKLKFSSKK